MNQNRLLHTLLALLLTVMIVFTPSGFSRSEDTLVSEMTETTQEVTATPAQEPTEAPTAEPTAEPTEEPTEAPTEAPTAEPTVEPTAEPTVELTATPSPDPTASQSAEPTETPTAEPTEPTANDLTELLDFSSGYVRFLNRSTLYETARGWDDAIYAMSKDVIAYAVQRPDAGGSPDRLLIAFNADGQLLTAYTDAENLYPLTEQEIISLQSEAGNLKASTLVYYQDDPSKPLFPAAYSILETASPETQAPTEAPVESATIQPTVTETETTTAKGVSGKLGSQLVNRSITDTADVTGTRTSYIYVSSVSELQSSHPYNNNTDTTWVYTVSDAARVTVSFSADTYVEPGYDYVVIYDAAGRYYAQFTGNTLAGRSVTVRGNRMFVRLISDSSLTYYGFRAVSSNPYTQPTLTSCFATGTSNGIQLRWAYYSFIDGYYIYRANTTQTGRTGAFSYLAYVPGSLNAYVDTTAVSGSINSYKIIAFTNVGGTVYRTLTSNTLNMSPVGQPTITSVSTTSSSSVTVNWNGVSGATGYRIFYATEVNGSYSLYGSVGASARSSLVSGLSSQPYYFKIRAERTIDASTYMGPYSAARLGLVGIDAPVFTSTHSPNASSMTVNWSAVTGATGYQLFRASTAAGPYSTYLGYFTGTSFTDRTCPVGQYSFYKVRAVVTTATDTAYSAMSNYTSAYPLNAPSGIQVTRLNDTQAQVSWNGALGATGYEVFTSNDGIVFTRYAVVSSATRACTATFASATETAYFQLRTIRIGGTKQFNSNMTRVHQTQLIIPTYRSLLIGQAYTGTSSLLRGTINDATAMRSMLANMTRTPYSSILRTDLTSGGILSNITSAFSGAGENDVSLFYYSGHGLYSTDSATLGSLVGVDFNIITPTALRNQLDTIAGRKIVIIDACHSGNMIGKSMNDGDAESFTKAFISAFASAGKSNLATGGYYVLVAASKDQSSYESVINGIYTGVFTRGVCYGTGWNELSSTRISSLYADANSDGYVSLNELYNYAIRFVDNAGFSTRQTTQVYPTNSAFQLFGR